MAAAGYAYISHDDGWPQGDRNADGTITFDEALWPGGMKAVADHIQAMPEAGICTDAGQQGCGYYWPTTISLLRCRPGGDITRQTVAYASRQPGSRRG
ncbi:hypothetical protein AQJ46_42580 [Streptomyces canus]|uniref:Alpha-galactosidase n=1 Tax=Streptomyces canus TaxID=58343 RepID=A0A101RNR8_9ACTN|nr:hypothetical protein [Streptomyces canus]KUN58956.1 hypothetical protein AQJ46_42580 [Streptomyces canus]